jgi:hypothetical protein
MSTTRTKISGTLKSDRILELDEGVQLPPGRVHGWVEAEKPAPPRSGAEVMAVLEGIWAMRRARGAPSRTPEEATAEVRKMRQEAEERLQRIEAMRSRARRQ